MEEMRSINLLSKRFENKSIVVKSLLFHIKNIKISPVKVAYLPF